MEEITGAEVLRRIRGDAGHFRAFTRCQREHLSGMSISHQCGDAGTLSKPSRKPAKLRFVDAVIRSERHGDGRDEAVEIDLRHGRLLQGGTIKLVADTLPIFAQFF